MKPTRILWAFLFITFVLSAIFVRQAEDTKYITTQLATDAEMNIVNIAKNVETCLVDKGSDNNLIDSGILDILSGTGDDIEEICNLKKLEGKYVHIKAINSGNEWEFGKRIDKKKASHTTWTNIIVKDSEKIFRAQDFKINTGIYEIVLQKVALNMKRDAIKISIRKPISGETRKFVVSEKSNMKTLYDSIIDSENIDKIFMLEVSEGIEYHTVDFIPDKYKFSEYGKSYTFPLLGDRPVWFEIENSYEIDMGMIYVET